MRFLSVAIVITISYMALSGASDVAAAISIAGVTPNPWAIAATIVLVAGRWSERYWLGAAIGLSADLHEFGRLGIVALTYLLVGSLATSVLVHVRRQGPALQTVAAVPIATALVLGEALGHFILGASAYTFVQLCGLALWTSVYTWLICAPLILIRSWWKELSYDRTATFGIR